MRLVVGLLALFNGILGLPRYSLAHVGEFTCAAGDVACLIDAITQANSNGVANTITLKAGTYTLTAVNNDTNGPNGLPSVTGVVTIRGARDDATIIERDASAPAFRLIHVATPGTLTLEGLTLRGGNAGTQDGGCLASDGGTVAIIDRVISNNRADLGGGLFNEQTGTRVAAGTIAITRSNIAHNTARIGGGLFTRATGGIVTITNSTISGNSGASGVGGLDNVTGTMIIPTTSKNILVYVDESPQFYAERGREISWSPQRFPLY
jgi:hypothetical protein